MRRRYDTNLPKQAPVRMLTDLEVKQIAKGDSGDCFGRYYNPHIKECGQCCEFNNCRAAVEQVQTYMINNAVRTPKKGE